MNDEAFQKSIRKMLKTVGVTTQQEIEKAVQQGLSEGYLQGDERLPMRVTVEVDGLNLALDFDGDITLE
jgi:N-methylhydantoinase B/oxoprolinase/acetone carboxylase alpha subunit